MRWGFAAFDRMFVVRNGEFRFKTERDSDRRIHFHGATTVPKHARENVPQSLQNVNHASWAQVPCQVP
jgi:hypothetical protein